MAARELLWDERSLDKSGVLTVPLGPAPESHPDGYHWREAFHARNLPAFASGPWGAVTLRGEDIIEVTDVKPRFEATLQAHLEQTLRNTAALLDEQNAEVQRNKEALQRAPAQGATGVQRVRRKGK